MLRPDWFAFRSSPKIVRRSSVFQVYERIHQVFLCQFPERHTQRELNKRDLIEEPTVAKGSNSIPKTMDNSAAAAAAAGGGNGLIVSENRNAETSEDQKQNLKQVINSINKTLGLIHQLYLSVSSFNVASQLPLLQRLNSLVMELDNMTKLTDKIDIQVPMQVLNLIDDGKNPDEFTRDVLNGFIAKNQITKGKADAFKSLRRHLLEELEQAFPDEVESYREIRATSAAEQKQFAQAQSILPNGDVKVKPEL